MTPAELIFVFWGIAGVLIGFVAACGWFAIPETPSTVLVIFVVAYFVGSFIPFGALCVKASDIGLNYGSSRVGDPKHTYIFRLKQAWLEVVPISGTATFTVPIAMILLSLARDSGEGLVAGVLSLFYTLPACFYLRFLPRGKSLIARWEAEEHAIAL